MVAIAQLAPRGRIKWGREKTTAAVQTVYCVRDTVCCTIVRTSWVAMFMGVYIVLLYYSTTYIVRTRGDSRSGAR
eukprot:COSAG01_NODE_8938_length_2608_cov_6.614333_4_plen_75_part_00